MKTDFYIEEVENLVSIIEHKQEKSVINLSDWNPSNNFMTKLAINIPYTFQVDKIPYFEEMELFF